MKRLLLSLCLLLPLGAAAQGLKIVDAFDGSSPLEWEEYSEKEASAMILNGYLELKCMQKDWMATIMTTLPIYVEHDFKISCNLTVSRLDKESRFGVLIDRDEAFNKCAFLFCEGTFECRFLNNGKFREAGETQRVKLKGGKDRSVDLVLERKGGKYILSVDNMGVFEQRLPITTPLFGFYTDGNSTLRINSVTVEQDYDGSEE